MCFVRTVWIMLGFETYGCPLWIADSVLAFDCSVEEVTGVELDTRFIGVYFKSNAGDWAGQFGCYLVDVAFSFQYPIVVKSIPELDLLIVEVGDVLFNGFGSVEVERSSSYSYHFTIGHERTVYRSNAIGCQIKNLVHAAYRRVTIQIEIRMVGQIDDGLLVCSCLVLNINGVVFG